MKKIRYRINNELERTETNSEFHSFPSAFIYVHPQLTLSIQEKTAAFYYALINKANTIFYQKSELNDRYLVF